ncbi:hypothetical protein PAL_GLEAN10017654 [Pteropus alecto]|uniref:Uncharacterized protein n=1 Tax=Pteropus alecto TaxID=9402 RepID=L5KYA8_PTEAL|nr:hypothetical protein PAL_GLEAN10017654 [Pteropus alecto]
MGPYLAGGWWCARRRPGDCEEDKHLKRRGERIQKLGKNYQRGQRRHNIIESATPDLSLSIQLLYNPDENLKMEHEVYP